MTTFEKPSWRSKGTTDPRVCSAAEQGQEGRCGAVGAYIAVFADKAAIVCEAHAAQIWAEHLPYVSAMATLDVGGDLTSQLNEESRAIMNGRAPERRPWGRG